MNNRETDNSHDIAAQLLADVGLVLGGMAELLEKLGETVGEMAQAGAELQRPAEQLAAVWGDLQRLHAVAQLGRLLTQWPAMTGAHRDDMAERLREVMASLTAGLH